MALPAGVVTCALTFGGDVDFSGLGIAVGATVVPSHDLVWAATGQRLVSFPVVVNVASGVPGSITVPVVDQSGFQDGDGNAFTNWAYTVTLFYQGVNGQKSVTKAVQPVTGQTVIDLDLLLTGSVTSPVSAPVATVTSVNGQTGAVTALGATAGSATVRALLSFDSAANWASVNPILGLNERALNTTDGFEKLGNGTSHWLDLNTHETGRPSILQTGDGTLVFASRPVWGIDSSGHPYYSLTGAAAGEGAELTFDARDGAPVLVKVEGAGRALTVAPSAIYFQIWQPLTAYLANQWVLNPYGQIVQALADFTSGASYNPANWSSTPSVTDASY